MVSDKLSIAYNSFLVLRGVLKFRKNLIFGFKPQ
jgi:hypothetical protein